jgi:hypothetical protein
MTDNERLERILQRINLPNCPKCGTPVIVENVVVGGNRHAMDDAVFPKVWLVCKFNKCAMRLLSVEPTNFTQSPDDELKALEDALNIR